MKPKISIITACFNSQKHIEQTINSVNNQTYENIEYIVVDGASTDDTMEIVNRYKNGIDIIISEPDKGIYDALNKGVRNSTGDLIYFLNSDDYLYEYNVVEKVADAYVAGGLDVKAVYGDVLKINERNGYSYIIGQKFEMSNFKKGKMPSHQGLFIKKELFLKFELFDTRYSIASDFDFVIKVFKEYYHHIIYLQETIAVFRIGGASTNLNNKIKTRQETIEIIDRHFEERNLRQFELQEINMGFYKKWIEILLFNKNPASSFLKQKGYHNVVLFGSQEMSLYVFKDLEESGINVLAFLDNDQTRHGFIMNGVPIYPVDWLRGNVSLIDAIVFSFEGSHENVLRKQIDELTAPVKITCISWKQIISDNMD